MLSALLLSLALSAPARADDAASGPRFDAAIELYQARKYPLALERFRALAAENGANPLADVAVALTELHLGRGADAGKALSRYAAAARRAADSRSGAAMTELEIASSPYILFGDEEGRPDLLKGLALLMTKSAPGDALGWELLGYFGLQSGDKEAIDAAAARLQILAPNSALAPFFSGFSATLAGDRASARAAFAEALRRDPDFAAARAALAQTDPSAAAPAADALATAQRRLTLLLVGAVLLFALFRLRAALLPPVDA